MDSLTDNGKGEFVHERDMNIGYPRMAEFCVIIEVPKSGLSTTFTEDNEKEEWRTWWVTNGVENENGIPVRDEDEEIQATINQLKLSKSALGGIPTLPHHCLLTSPYGLLRVLRLQRKVYLYYTV
jgi:hypothetical protein